MGYIAVGCCCDGYLAEAEMKKISIYEHPVIAKAYPVESVRELAERYGVSRQAIYDILKKEGVERGICPKCGEKL